MSPIELIYNEEVQNLDMSILHPEGIFYKAYEHSAYILSMNVKPVHHARIITYADVKKATTKLVSLLTNDMEMDPEEIVKVYKKKMDY